jgi:hypothetical protein
MGSKSVQINTEAGGRDLLASYAAAHPGSGTRIGAAGRVPSQPRWSEAEAAFRELLVARRERFGDDHPHTRVTRFALAAMLAGQGRWDEAAAELEDVLAAQRLALGDEHPDTLKTRHLLSATRAAQRRFAEAEGGFRDVLDARQRVLGKEHPDTLVTCHELARSAALQERWGASVDAFRQLLHTRRRVLGDHHPETMATWPDLTLMTMVRSVVPPPRRAPSVLGATLLEGHPGAEDKPGERLEGAKAVREGCPRRRGQDSLRAVGRAWAPHAKHWSGWPFRFSMW